MSVVASKIEGNTPQEDILGNCFLHPMIFEPALNQLLKFQNCFFIWELKIQN